MDMDKKLGLMDQFIKVNISKARNMDMEDMNGMMAPSMMATGMKIRSKDLELIAGWTVECIRENG